jgi:hypothetical protein
MPEGDVSIGQTSRMHEMHDARMAIPTDDPQAALGILSPAGGVCWRIILTMASCRRRVHISLLSCRSSTSAKNLPALYERLVRVLDAGNLSYELVFCR